MPFRSEEQRKWMWMNKPKMARKWTDEHGSKPVKAGLGRMLSKLFRRKGTAHASSSSSQGTGDPGDKMLDYFKTKYSGQIVHAKKGKYQEFKHPQHDILPLEHMEESMSSKERVERLLDERKKKKESKKKVAKDGQSYVPGWRPNLSVKAAEGELVRQKTQGTGAAIKGIEHYTMKGMPTAQTGELIQTPTRGTGAAVKGTDHYVMQGMDAAKEGKMIKAKKGKRIGMRTDAGKLADKRQRLYEQAHGEFYTTGLFGRKKSDASTGGGAPPPLRLLSSMKDYWQGKPDSLTRLREFNKKYPPPKDSKYQLKTGGPIKAKKGVFSGASSSMYDKPPGWDVKKISDKTHKKLTKLWKHREAGGWSPAAGKKYRAHLKTLKKLTTKPSTFLKRRKQLAGLGDIFMSKPAINQLKKNIKKSKSFYFKDSPSSDFLKRRMTLAGAARITEPYSLKALANTNLLKVAKKLGKRTGLGKAVVAATVVAGAYEAGKRKLFTKDKKKKKVDKKSIGGETVVMKSGGGYIDDLL